MLLREYADNQTGAYATRHNILLGVRNAICPDQALLLAQQTAIVGVNQALAIKLEP